MIAAVAYRPFEGERRVFVIEAADAMAEESQNALLKTLEEPPPYAHLILITTEPAALLETVRSRCQEVRFAALSPASVERRLAAELPGADPVQIAALAALGGGDLGRARLLGSPTGARLRDLAERCARATLAGELLERPWADLLSVAAERGKQQAAAVVEAAGERAEEIGKGRDADRIRREGGEAAKRAERRARTEAIDLALGLVAIWFSDVVTVAEGAPELARNADRIEVADRGREGHGSDRGAAGRGAGDGDPPAPAGQRERGARDGCSIPPGGPAAWRTGPGALKGNVPMATTTPRPAPPNAPELPVTADRPAIQPTPRRRVFGVRLWLALMFSAVGILTGTSVYIFVSGSSENAAENRSADLAAGRTFRLREAVEAGLPARAADEGERPERGAPGVAAERRLPHLALQHALRGQRGRDRHPARRGGARHRVHSGVPGGRPIGPAGRGAGDADRPPRGPHAGRRAALRPGGKQGVLISVSERPEEVQSALDALRGQRLTALVVSVIVAGLIGFLVASLITGRVKRLAAAAGELAEGHLDKPLNAGGRDEIGDLGRTLDSMRIALAETFDALSSERDRLSAVFTSLDEAVIVVDPDGDVRFANPAAGDLIRRRRARGRGAAALDPPRHPPRQRRERSRADRRPRLRDRRPLPPGGALGPARRPRPHRRAAPRPGRARVRLQRRPRAAQPDRRHVGGDRGAALRRQGRPRGPRALPQPPRRGRRPRQPADQGAADARADGGDRRGRGRRRLRRPRDRGGDRRPSRFPTASSCGPRSRPISRPTPTPFSCARC